MGIWSASITGNDTAMDLRSEYTSAFFYYGVPEALEKIDAYVRADGFSEADTEEWCNYVYSLTDFMWSKGILTDGVLRRTIEMIDSGFGLELWAEEGASTLNARKKALEKFRAKITSPQPPRKKIKPDVYLEDIFTHGDLIAIRLQTAGKHYFATEIKPLSEEYFHSLDGKYVLIQKVGCCISWRSQIVPEVSDHWPVFRLFKGIYDSVPEAIDYDSLETAEFKQCDTPADSFICESSMSYFKKRKYEIIGNYYAPVDNTGFLLPFRKSSNFYNADSFLIAALLCGESSRTNNRHPLKWLYSLLNTTKDNG